MAKLEKVLAAEQLHPVNYKYPSRSAPIEVLATETIPAAVSKCPKYDQVHFVTHSMGGILVRQYLHDHTLEKLGRVVMLGPPNQGSEVVDSYQHVPGFTLFGGPAGFQLGTGEASVPGHLGPVNFELGVIAGSRSINLILSLFLPGKDDGKVTIESTKVEGMTDHITLPVTHPFMMKNKKVIQQVLQFLEHGAFQSPETTEAQPPAKT
ncbi:hypothetical protein GCM10007877_36190 [Marinibactrum halimedae]|uniref:Alpha/beta hydrolase n=2 Tax=Marinibactrum halimedae TaxID=1444977 RepID=A0AA37T6H2_9GAMM|nr:alpha/beta hydrolase [Marinibactrum halimedae]GLS27900.1 hypothetical protein GCM10007877_36190 [Marinibactrum halimedae]